MLVLDACCGPAIMYDGWNMNLGDNWISIDIRKGDFSFELPSCYSEHKTIVKPLMLADLKKLPFKDGLFDSIVFDPPHYSCGINSFLRKRYGSWDHGEVKQSLIAANLEFARVLRTGGTLVLKIMPTDLETYQKLLTNFAFYLPIHTVRPAGICKGSRKEQNSALWSIGIKKEAS